MTTENQTIDNGGPAFPVEQHDKDGMTLRDYFAARAMQGMIISDTQWSMTHEILAVMAYIKADAMLEARKGGAA